jgi:hypothetical protein
MSKVPQLEDLHTLVEMYIFSSLDNIQHVAPILKQPMCVWSSDSYV